MSRRSSESAPGTVSTTQVAPPSVVCATRPRVPLAHATVELTAARPRNSAVVLLACGAHCAAAGAVAAPSAQIIYRRHPRILVAGQAPTKERDGDREQREGVDPVAVEIHIREPTGHWQEEHAEQHERRAKDAAGSRCRHLSP